MAEVTNYIDRLVAELCPDGVEYRPLGEIADVTSGYVFPVKYQGNEKSAEDNIPFYKVSDMNLPGNEMFMTSSNNYVSAESAKEMRASLAQPESIIFPKIGAAIATNKKRILTEKSIVDNNVMVVTARSVINSKFLYYVLSAFDLMSWSMGAGAVPSIKKSVVVKHEVPVPPLEIQEAIVEILDKFTNLEAELEAELEARTLQYEYYRDSLFEALDCPRVSLGELGKFYGGLKGKTKNDFGSSGARYISYKNVYENISADFTWPDFVQVKEGENQLSLMKGDILLTGSSENMEEAGLSSVVTKEPEEKAYLNSFSICYRLNDPSILNPEFSKYLFRSRLARKQIIRTAQGVTRFNVSKKKLANVSIPIPSLEEQQRIVDILDRFDALTSSLSEGLPAELAARRSQYEYYRDQLLTFPRKGDNQ